MNNQFFNNKNGDDVIDIKFNSEFIKKFKKNISRIIIIFLIVIIALNSYYVLDSKQAGVIVRLGEVSHVEYQAGIHIKYPFIDQVRKVNYQEVYKMEYGYQTEITGTEKSNPEYVDVTDESQVIVDAANNNASIILLSLAIQYKIKEPDNYLFKVDDVEGTLRLALEDVIRNTLQAFSLDEARTNKEYIDEEILPQLQNKLDTYEIGIQITSVQTQNVELLPAVEEAYNQKENANQYMNAKLEEAQKYNNTIIPQAEAEAEKLVEEATGYKAEVIANAKAAVAQFEALYAEYQVNPEIVKEKYYIEAMNQFIRNNNMVLDLTNDSDIYKFYNLENKDAVKQNIAN